MEGDTRSDEALLAAYEAGDKAAFGILFKRYCEQLRFYLLKKSHYKDSDFLDGLVQEVFLKLLTNLKKRGFKALGPGAVRSYLYQTAQNLCYKENKRRVRQARPVSESFPEGPNGMPEDTLSIRPKTQVNYERLDKELAKVWSQLTPEEQRLMELISQGRKYREIIQEEPFRKFSVAYLKLKIYNTRRKIRKLKER